MKCVSLVKIEARNTCEFHSPEDWTDDTKEYQETDDGNTRESNEEDRFDNQLRGNIENNLDPEINRDNLYDQERDIHTLNRGKPMNGINYGQQILNKAWRQPYGRADQDMYQPNNLQNAERKGDALYEHENMAQALAKQKDIKYIKRNNSANSLNFDIEC